MEMEEAKYELIGAQAPERSEARARYSKTNNQRAAHSRNTHSKETKSSNKPEGKTWRERVVFQAIICGSFLAVMLLFNIVDSDFTNNITGWVNRNITTDIFTEDGGMAVWMENVLGFFNNAIESVEMLVPENTTNPAEMPDTWVDESILTELD